MKVHPFDRPHDRAGSLEPPEAYKAVPRRVRGLDGQIHGRQLDPGVGIPSLKQHDHEFSGLQFGLQFTAIRPSSPEYTRGV